MSDHYQHQQAVAAARAELQEYRNRLAAAAEKAEEVLGMINNAVGEQHLVESARNAFEMVAASQQRAHEALQAATQADFELQRYQGGF